MGHGQAANCYPRTDYYLGRWVCKSLLMHVHYPKENTISGNSILSWIMHMTKTTKPCSNSQLWESTTAISISLGSFMGGSEMKPSKLKNVRTYKKVADLVDH